MTTLDSISSDDPVGNPYFNASRKPKNQVRVMFLGGRLDHTVRTVPSIEGHPDRPSDETYLSPAVPRAPWLPPEYNEQYKLVRVDNSRGAWFCYILDGHTPSPSSLLDTNPYPI